MPVFLKRQDTDSKAFTKIKSSQRIQSTENTACVFLFWIVGSYPIKGHDNEMDFFHFLYNSDAHRTLPKKFDQNFDFILEFAEKFE